MNEIFYISYVEALKIVLENFNPLEFELLPVDSCLNRVLAEDLKAKKSVPPANISKVDGYAIKYNNEGSYTFKWVNTGEVLPEGFDRVVKVEDVDEIESKLFLKKKPEKWENVRKRGEDIEEGEVVLRKGSYLNALKIITLKNCGIEKVKVHRKPRVAVLATGDELEKEIPATNHFMLSSLLKKLCDVKTFLAKDDRKQIESFLLEYGYDLLITTGGTSKGKRDLMRQVVNQLGKILFEGSRIKPGRTAFFGRIDQTSTPVFCLPGTPSACLAAFMLYVRPAIFRMLDLTESRIKAEVTENADAKVTRFILVNYDGERARMLKEGFFKSLLKANSFLILGEGERVAEGEVVEIHLLELIP